ncbi:cobaltochelatase subunit CobN [Magnetovibrio blakemorei]|uniref:Cobaltochelatase subunit CobN n=1 Tax=Magnetovibrio blakemorei TaxID=28181 RepID=A0A1E5Q9C8_9PROT|nr:cobaltochelatase subunit CobN [Magnetovibrio blakemorei]OEJ67690.1 cobaltochelatase subunit CobN [Magnetovibrio blakemorei]
MHLLAAQPGSVQDGSEAVDLGQLPGDILVISAADTEISALALARRQAVEANGGEKDFPTLRLANMLHLGHNMSVDLYVDSIVRHAKLVVVRVLGGRGYWPYGIDEVVAACQSAHIPVAILPGDDQPDAELAGLCTLNAQDTHRLWQYLVLGGPDNARGFIDCTAKIVGYAVDCVEPCPVLPAGLYWPGQPGAAVSDIKYNLWREGLPIVPVIFYRALFLSSNLAVIDDLFDELQFAGLNPLPIYVASLKDPVSQATVSQLLKESDDGDVLRLGCVLNTTGFSASSPGSSRVSAPWDAYDVTVLQVILSGGHAQTWTDNAWGLGPRDIAMNVALPEVDGRIISRAISFKDLSERDDATQCDLVRYKPIADRVHFVAQLAKRWAWLRTQDNDFKRVAIVLANYPNKDARLGNGVGLDTPAGIINTLHAMQKAGFDVDDIPSDGNALIERLKAGPTNAHKAANIEAAEVTLSLEAYQGYFESLPETVQDRVIKQWGTPETDPFMRGDGSFAISVFLCGEVAIGLQPARGYNIDPQKTYHDPDLVPPHGYLAFYAWLRDEFDTDVIVHFGKHGNLEWLPGKAVALSSDCFSEAALGPMAHLYPFIVNDPGEGTQAKRRAQAVIIDHLTPPLARAESYGPLRHLEQLVDEYFEASGTDPRRTKVLKRDILELCHVTGLAQDAGMVEDASEDERLATLDAYLCELKEMQIRDGLHIFGNAPQADLLDALLVALVRVSRGTNPKDASLIRALAEDLALNFDPLDCNMAEPWAGPKPKALQGMHEPWRTAGDTVERLESLALALVKGDTLCGPEWTRTTAVMTEIETRIRPAVEACGEAEIQGIVRGLEGRFVEPGPSGAPTRGRPDVLPTGRNFYSVDTRAVPTPAAWTLGWKSAGLVLDAHLQAHGEWPKTMAVTAWGTSNMRTGGDDIAQALALMGVRPTWDASSRRVTGFEVMPIDVLGRPRVDVTLRISGFFRDAFPGLIDLFDSAVRAVAQLDENAAQNPLAAKVTAEIDELIASGVESSEASRRAGFRVFGSMPGAYGAGLQALMDEKGWQTDADLAKAYVAWGGYAYGAGAEGEARHGLFETRLKAVQAVVQNQDNREHDLLDSDDYYQFEGGITAAVRVLSGHQPATWHVDTSRPDIPKARTLEDEIGRVVRARVVNPKWIAGVMRHGYKGAFEMAATVDYLVSFAATAHCVKDHHFDAVFQAYLDDETVQDFLRANNPDALRDMAARLIEAQDRGLWTSRLNSTRALLDSLL